MPSQSARSLSRLEQYRREKEEREMQECTFEPQIEQWRGGGTSGRSRGRDISSEPPEERLIAERERVELEREKLRVMQQRAEVADCTFQPVISARSHRLANAKNRKPIEERFIEDQQAKQVRTQAMEQKLYGAIPFEPQLSERERARRDELAARALERTGVSQALPLEERLSSPSSVRPEHFARTLSRAEQEMTKECTFQPSINEASRRISRSSSGRAGGFLQRQQAYEEARRRRQQEVEQAMYSDVTFQPTLLRSRVRSASAGGAQRARETQDDVFERLSSQNLKPSLSARLSKAVESEGCTFEPEIDPVSRSRARPVSLEDLYSNPLVAYKKEQLRARLEQERTRECTFSPEVYSKGAKPHYDMSNPDAVVSQIHYEKQQRDVRLNMLKKRLEYDEIESCSFRPEVHTEPPPQTRGPTITRSSRDMRSSEIRGLSRFMELREKTERMKEEQRELEDRVFGRKLPAGPPGAYMEPKPFHLSYETAARRREEKMRRLEEAAMEQCTFQPETSEMKMRALVAGILKSGE